LFFKADTIAELARLVVGNRFLRMPLKYLDQTVARFNGYARAGVDPEFGAEGQCGVGPVHGGLVQASADPPRRRLASART
jgi:hypothetical protein